MSIKHGDMVSVHYIGTFEDGIEFDRSAEDRPLTFKIGEGQVIEGFERAVIGKDSGDIFSVTIPAEEAYGEHEEALVFEVERSQLPEAIHPEIGLVLTVETDQGELEVSIVDISDESILLDANHPMAGEDLTFEITIV